MPVDVLEKPAKEEIASREAISSVTIDERRSRVPSTQPNPTGESKNISRRQKIGKHLHIIFEGHDDFLGWTPD